MAGKLRARVLNYAGTIITEDLAHLTLKGEVRADPQGLNIAQAQIGRATIPLFPPASPSHSAEAYVYSQLTLGQRVEIYPDSGQGTAVPIWSGIIDRLPSSRNNYSVECADSLQMAQNSHRLIPFSTSETADVIIQKYGIKYYAPAYSNSLANVAPTGIVTTTNGTATWSSGTFEGTPGLYFTPLSGTPFSTIILSGLLDTSSFGDSITVCDLAFIGVASGGLNAQIIACTQTTSGTGAKFAAQISPAFGAAGVLATAQAGMISTSVTGAGPIYPIGNMDATGKFTYRMQVAFVLRGVDSGGSIPWEVLVNGQSVGAVHSGSTGPVASRILATDVFPTGYVGLRVLCGTAAPQAWYSNLTVLKPAQLFKLGTLPAATITQTPPQHNFNNATCLEIMKAACAQEGWSIRKTPGVGFGGDTLDFSKTF